jgi:MerR family copper efflux transcriptional regulator
MRTGGGYRVYDEAALARLTFIQAAARCGFSLAEVGRLLALADMRGRLSRRTRAELDWFLLVLDGRIAQLTDLRERLRSLSAPR